jgi:hypothetical protein
MGHGWLAVLMVDRGIFEEHVRRDGKNEIE